MFNILHAVNDLRAIGYDKYEAAKLIVDERLGINAIPLAFFEDSMAIYYKAHAQDKSLYKIVHLDQKNGYIFSVHKSEKCVVNKLIRKNKGLLVDTVKMNYSI